MLVFNSFMISNLDANLYIVLLLSIYIMLLKFS